MVPKHLTVYIHRDSCAHTPPSLPVSLSYMLTQVK